MADRDAGWKFVAVDGASGDADQAAAAARARVLGVGLVDVAGEVDVGPAPGISVGFALVREPAIAEGVMGQEEDELVFGEIGEGLCEGLLAEAEAALIEIAGCEESGVEANEAETEDTGGEEG